ncbi:MAG: sigma-70 region 4 domain-containing protein [Oscillospiraceae bacterium]|jgi:predicted transcriptional regulator|nr:sigma-70 region 4 domain-containing protein [Oscillospiraceae bacterium]
MTDRQKRQIEAMRRKGCSYAEISDELELSPNTVKSYCQRSRGGSEGDVCRNCGEPIMQNHGAKQKNFCSNHCRQDWWNHNRNQINHRDRRTAICDCCGQAFEVHGKRKQRFCSQECYADWRRGG